MKNLLEGMRYVQIFVIIMLVCKLRPVLLSLMSLRNFYESCTCTNLYSLLQEHSWFLICHEPMEPKSSLQKTKAQVG